MASRVADAEIEVTADTRQYERALDAVASKARQAADLAGSATSTAWKKATTAVSSDVGKMGELAKRAAEQMGGQFATLGGVLGDLVAPLGAISAGLATVAGGAVGIGVVAAATYGLVEGAEAARDRLTELGVIIDQDVSQSIDRWQDATSELSGEWDRLVLTAGAELAPALSLVAQSASEGIRTFREWREEVEFAARIARGIATLGLSELVGATGELTIEVERSAIAIDQFVGPLQTWETTAGRVTTAVRGLTEAEREAARQRAEVMEQFLGDEALKEETLAAALEHRREWRALELEEEVQSAEALRELMLGDNEKKLEAEEELNAEIDRIHRERNDTQRERDKATAALQRSLALQVASDITQIGQTITDRLAEQFADRARAASEHYQEVLANTKATSDEEFAILTDAARRERDEARKRADLAYGLSQSLAATQAIIQSIVMGSGIAANLAPATGLAAPVIAAGVASAFLGTQLAAIATAPPPEFPTGMTPDHYPAALQAGEGVANRVAMADPDFANELRDRNAGRASTSTAGGAVDVRVSMDPRTHRLRLQTVSRMPGKRGRRR